MTNQLPTVAVAVLLATSIAPLANVASAMPVADALAIKNAASTNVETVQWRGRGWRGGPGWGVGAGFLGGAIIGGLLASPYYYGPGLYYGPGPYYGPRVYYGPRLYYGPGPYYPAPGYVGPAPGDAVAYCMQRFKSYDLGSGTYLGYDGLRHPCP